MNAALILDWVAVLDVVSVLFMVAAMMMSADGRCEASGAAVLTAGGASALSLVVAIIGALVT